MAGRFEGQDYGRVEQNAKEASGRGGYLSSAMS